VATKIGSEEGTLFSFLNKAWMPGRQSFAYFSSAVARKVRRQQAELRRSASDYVVRPK